MSVRSALPEREKLFENTGVSLGPELLEECCLETTRVPIERRLLEMPLMKCPRGALVHPCSETVGAKSPSHRVGMVKNGARIGRQWPRCHFWREIMVRVHDPGSFSRRSPIERVSHRPAESSRQENGPVRSQRENNRGNLSSCRCWTPFVALA